MLPRLPPLMQVVGQMVLPFLTTADDQAAFMTAVSGRSNDDIRDFVILPATHCQKVNLPLQYPQGVMSFLPANLPTIDGIPEVIHVYPVTASPFLGAQLDKFQYLADGKFANHCLFSFSIYARSSSSSDRKSV